MAFTVGVPEPVPVTTYDGATPTTPTNPVVTVSLDGGVTFIAATGDVLEGVDGVTYTITAAESLAAAAAGFRFVKVRVASDNCDMRSEAFFFEGDWTAMLATRLGYQFLGTWTVVSASEETSPSRTMIRVTEPIGAINALIGATLVWLTGNNVGSGPRGVLETIPLMANKFIIAYPSCATLPVVGETFALFAVSPNIVHAPLTTADMPLLDLNGYVRTTGWMLYPAYSQLACVGQVVQWGLYVIPLGAWASLDLSFDSTPKLDVMRVRDGIASKIGATLALTTIEQSAGPWGIYGQTTLAAADWQAGDMGYFLVDDVGISVNQEGLFYPFRQNAASPATMFTFAVLPANPALGPGTGERTYTVTVNDAGGNPISNVTVGMSLTETGNIEARATTNLSGEVVLQLDDGTPWLHAYGVTGYTHDPEQVTVSEIVTSATLEMAAFDPGAPADPSLRRVWMRTWRADGEYVTGTPAFTVHLDVACKYEDGRLGERRTVGSTDAVDHSYAYADLLPTDALTPVTAGDTVLYRVQIHETGEEATFALPTGDLSAIELASLI